MSLSVYPNDNSKVIDYIAFAFVYGYNKNTMTAYSAMLNIASTAASDESGTSSGEGEPNSTNGGENEPDDFIDYEVVSETLDTSQEYMRSTTTYTSDGNYTASQTDEAGHTVYYTYDVDGNVTESIDGNGYDTQYEYDAAGNVIKLKNGTSQNLYSYNGAGTISAIQHNGFQYDFNYDVFGKLISTKIGNTALSSNTYSASGLLTRTTYANGDYIEYSYDAYDRVIQMKDENGVFARFVYNKKGLVTKYIDTEIQMYYDSNGLRTQKGDIYYYYDSESKLIALKKNALTMFFYYDSSDNPIAFSYNGCMHYYVKNLQGDIVRVVNEAGNTAASYEYDAWGKLLAAKNYYGVPVTDPNSIVLVNPLRYRGYVYDDETGLYYLQSRYYDPTTCRFINADVLDYITSNTNIFNTNLFTYCNNNFRASDYNGKYSNYFSSKTYNRNNALTYARLNYYKKQGNSMFRYYGGKGGDCANFVSQCLYFGGIRMSTGWHFFKGILKDDWTASWISAPAQYKYFRLWGFTKYIITIDKEDYFDKRCLRRIITHYGIKSGDLMYMDFNGDGEVDHATMITGHSFGTELYFTAHSDSKYGFPVRRVFYDTQNRRWRKPKMILKIVVLL